MTFQTQVTESSRLDLVPLTKLIGYVIDRHHVYARRRLADIHALLSLLPHADEGTHPVLSRLRGLFEVLRQELLLHMEREEVSIFPRVIRADTTSRHDDPQAAREQSHVSDAVRMLTQEHGELCGILSEIRAATDDYDPQGEGRGSYGPLYRALGELEADLSEHLHLEDNVLFPRAVEEERRRRG
jgi:regulator of cell morphogenesis and NO signaling